MADHDLQPTLRDGMPALACRRCRRRWLPHQDRGLDGSCPGPRNQRPAPASPVSPAPDTEETRRG